MYFKDFDKWNAVKKRIHADERKVSIRAGEVRWISCGVNVGSEIDGKGESFTRPALIVHVVGSVLALIAPLSTKTKDVAGYIPFDFQGKQISICVHQIRIISQRRILSRKGRISDKRLAQVAGEIKSFLLCNQEAKTDTTHSYFPECAAMPGKMEALFRSGSKLLADNF